VYCICEDQLLRFFTTRETIQKKHRQISTAKKERKKMPTPHNSDSMMFQSELFSKVMAERLPLHYKSIYEITCIINLLGQCRKSKARATKVITPTPKGNNLSLRIFSTGRMRIL
jgi:hypothetical protein